MVDIPCAKSKRSRLRAWETTWGGVTTRCVAVMHWVVTVWCMKSVLTRAGTGAEAWRRHSPRPSRPATQHTDFKKGPTSGVLKVGVGGDPPYPPGSDAYGSYYTITIYKLQQSLMLLIDYDQVILGAWKQLLAMREVTVTNWYAIMNFVCLVFIARQHTDARYWYSKSVCLSVRLSVRNVPVSDENSLIYRQFFSPYGSPIVLVLPASNVFTKFRRGLPMRWR